jgi:dienelactone hydrolase
VLHGAGGMLGDGPEMRRMARALADAGNAVYLIHYFNRTGTLFGRDANIQKNFESWLGTVRDSIEFARGRNSNSSSVGIYGYSLGGFLALAAASENPHVAAVVEQAGGVWNGKKQRIGQMPPVFMVHGEQDRRVPFQKYAEPLLSLLRKRGGEVETHFFPSEGHILPSRRW